MWTSSFSVLCLLQQPSHGHPSKTLRGNLVLTTSPKDTLTHCEQESYGHLPSARPTEPQLPILVEKLPFCTQPFCRQPQRSLGGAGVLSLAGSRCHPGEPGDIKASSQEETNAAPRWTRDEMLKVSHITLKCVYLFLGHRAQRCRPDAVQLPS